MFLSEDQVRELTDRSQAPAQVKRLIAMKIPYRYVPGGRVKVLSSDVEGSMAVEATAEPDFTVFDKRG